MSAGPEFTRVELPLVQQLKELGWVHLEGSKSDPGVTGRGSFREVFLERRLRDSLRRINLDPSWSTLAGRGACLAGRGDVAAAEGSQTH